MSANGSTAIAEMSVLDGGAAGRLASAVDGRGGIAVAEATNRYPRRCRVSI
jgi:hypothetical protein